MMSSARSQAPGVDADQPYAGIDQQSRGILA
jgi:hypothetical protein